jgi:hypothetical protein
MHAQSDLAIGEWKSYLPYKSGLYVTQGPEKIYYGTEFSVFSINKEDFSAQFLSKTEGLSDIGISVIKYDGQHEQLIIAYSNSNIDIVKGTDIFNIPSIKLNTNIIGDKTVYNIHIASNGRAYLACGFGVLELDLEKKEFGFTSFSPGVRILDITSKGSMLFAASDEGVYSADLGSNLNLGDFNNWTFLGGENGMPLLYEATNIEVYKDKLYILSEGTLYKETDDLQMISIYQVQNEEEVGFLSAEGERLILGLRNGANGQLHFFDENDQIITGSANCSNVLLYAIEDESGRIWYADEWNDIRYANSYTSDCQRINFDTPYSHKIGEINIFNNEVFVSSGGVSDGYNFLENRDGFYILTEGDWKNYNGNSFYYLLDNDIKNVFRIVPNPANPDILYIGSFYSGLMKLKRSSGEAELFKSTNSVITGPAAGPDIEKIGGLAFDDNNHLWISSYESTEPLVAMSSSGNFHTFNVQSSNKLAQIAVDDYGYKWIVVKGNSGGVLVYDDGDKIEDPSDDRQRLINSSNSELPNNNINCIEVDRDGDVWVGTTEGPVIFECGDPFDSNCMGSRRRVLQDSIPALLLQYEEIRTIAADGANRKWIGTRNGVFVQSPSGEFEEHRYTVNNSPLFDNNIIDLAYNPLSGEMFIASDKGLQSIRTETLGSKQINEDEIVVFPNPVRPEYDGPIAIKGVAQDADVKITDMNGRLVYETQALGGQAIWDGKDYNGRKVASGVYLVFISSTPFFDEPDTATAKILFLN